MSFRKTLLIPTLILFCTALFLFLQRRNIEKQREWPSIQAERAKNLNRLLLENYKEYSNYPKNITDLVDSKKISLTDFEDLKFQKSQKSSKINWIYQKPESNDDIVIKSPEILIPWKGSRGVFIAIQADGKGQVLSNKEKLP